MLWYVFSTKITFFVVREHQKLNKFKLNWTTCQTHPFEDNVSTHVLASILKCPMSSRPLSKPQFQKWSLKTIKETRLDIFQETLIDQMNLFAGICFWLHLKNLKNPWAHEPP